MTQIDDIRDTYSKMMMLKHEFVFFTTVMCADFKAYPYRSEIPGAKTYKDLKIILVIK